MRNRTRLFAVLGLLGLTLLTGCGGTAGSFVRPPPPAPGGEGGTPPFPGTGLVLSITDTPPAGVTVLSFGVTITGAVLQPGNISLIANPVQVEIKHLEAQTALLGLVNIPTGSYASMNATFSSPKLTILNNTGAAIGTCANGLICEFEPSLSSSSAMLSGAPFPLALNGLIYLKLDFDLNNSISSGLTSINPMFTLTAQQLSASPGPGGAVDHFNNVFGQVTSLAQGGPIGPLTRGEVTNSATLQTHLGPIGITFQLDDVQFDGFAAMGCQDQNIDFSCLRAGQFWEVDLTLFANGFLQAQTIRLKPANEQELEGLLVAINSPNQFDMVVFSEVADVAGVEIGNLVRTNLSSEAIFGVDGEPLPLSGLSFSGVSDMLVGQAVRVRLRSTPSGTPLTVDANRVLLRTSSLTAKVKSKLDAENFTVDNLPGLFSEAQIQVETRPQTTVENAAGVGALNVGDTVSLGGLLFKTASDPVMSATRVRKR